MARAMWKAVVRFGDVRVPVKLYAAVADRSVHFRLLHRKDHAPVKQAMVNPETEEVVPYDEVRRAFVTSAREIVMLDDADLAEVTPEVSRDIEVLQFVPPSAIDHRWYQRPYFLGPDDGADDQYAVLTAALSRAGREGLARWVMRRKAYVGALRVEQNHLMLMSLRHAEQMVSVDELPTPQGPALVERELDMARQLMDMLSGPFEPERYQDEYRARVDELIETKARGGRIPKAPARRRKAPEDLTSALEASLKQERKRA